MIFISCQANEKKKISCQLVLLEAILLLFVAYLCDSLISKSQRRYVKQNGSTTFWLVLNTFLQFRCFANLEQCVPIFQYSSFRKVLSLFWYKIIYLENVSTNQSQTIMILKVEQGFFTFLLNPYVCLKQLWLVDYRLIKQFGLRDLYVTYLRWECQVLFLKLPWNTVHMTCWYLSVTPEWKTTTIQLYMLVSTQHTNCF